MYSTEGLIGLADLTAYLRMFSVLVGSGVNLLTTMQLLDGSISSEPLRDANRKVREGVEGGGTLSRAMSEYPKMFPGFLVTMVRAGEVGGVLDETLAVAADFYQRQAEHRHQRYAYLATARVLGKEHEDRYLATVREVEVRLVVQYFCYMFGTMLAAGVPIVQALEVAADILRELRAHDEVRVTLADAVLQARDAIGREEGLAPPLEAGGFPEGALALIRIGEDEGTLDRMAIHAGDLLGAEIEGRMQEALGLNYW